MTLTGSVSQDEDAFEKAANEVRLSPEVKDLFRREFLLRGMEKVKIELNLACIAHNLQKINRMLGEKRMVIA